MLMKKNKNSITIIGAKISSENLMIFALSVRNYVTSKLIDFYSKIRNQSLSRKPWWQLGAKLILVWMKRWRKSKSVLNDKEST